MNEKEKRIIEKLKQDKEKIILIKKKMVKSMNHYKII